MRFVLTPAIRARVVLALCLLLVSHAPRASAQTAASTGIPAEKVKRIEALISEEMARLKIPGLSVAVATGGRVRWSNGYGLADVENNVAAKAATVYRLASVSKPITAVAVMQLAERGKIDLDAPVQK
jgi:CubicO group peptidase (beta-lactamase class C family)